jgi:hypothetical protein
MKMAVFWVVAVVNVSNVGEILPEYRALQPSRLKIFIVVVWSMTPCILVGGYQRSGRACRLCL